MPKKVFGVFCLGKPDKPKQITHTHKSHKCHPFERHLLYIIHMVWQIFGERKWFPTKQHTAASFPAWKFQNFNPRLLDQFFGKETCRFLQHSYVVVSKNRGTPKWMVYNGKGWFGGKPTIFGNIPMWLSFYEAVNPWDEMIPATWIFVVQQEASKKGVQTNLGDKSIWIVMSNWTRVLCLLYFTSLSSLIAENPIWKNNLNKLGINTSINSNLSPNSKNQQKHTKTWSNCSPMVCGALNMYARNVRGFTLGFWMLGLVAYFHVHTSLLPVEFPSNIFWLLQNNILYMPSTRSKHSTSEN